MSLFRKGEAIRLVNKDLGCPKKRTADSTIASVALLAGMENLSGNVEVLKLHIDALEKLVKMRGGTEKLGMGGILHTTVFCQDLLAATMMGTKPRFEPVRYKKLASRREKFLREGGTNAKPGMREISGLAICGGYQEDLVNIFQDLHNMTIVLQTVHNFTVSQMVAFGDVRSCIEHRLLCLPKKCPYHGTREHECVFEPNRLAALIYSNYAFRSFAPALPLLVVLKRSLIEVFERKEEAHLKVACESDILSGAVLWIYCMGAILALSDVEKEWFALRIARVIVAMGLDGWTDCDYQLKSRFLWTSKMSSVMYDSYFDQIELRISLERKY
ncbi:hypothetical protein MMC11_007624 [Xylographa trunciseda]|nr:hypothetical protein [Xylographa trunciseda]